MKIKKLIVEIGSEVANQAKEGISHNRYLLGVATVFVGAAFAYEYFVDRPYLNNMSPVERAAELQYRMTDEKIRNIALDVQDSWRYATEDVRLGKYARAKTYLADGYASIQRGMKECPSIETMAGKNCRGPFEKSKKDFDELAKTIDIRITASKPRQ